MNFKITLPERNNYQIAYTKKVFAGGEVQVRLLKLPVGIPAYSTIHVTIDGLIKNSEMLMEFVMLCDALNRALSPSLGDVHITADLHYLPYARQDRVCSPGESFALSQFISVLRTLPVSKYIFDDVHSNVAIDLMSANGIDFENRNQSQLLLDDNVFCLPSGITLASPDKGASKKTEALGFYSMNDVVFYDKMRNSFTGAIERTELASGVEFINRKDCLIVDDICDGGRTFVPIIKDLHERGAKTVSLCVTHAILPYGLDALREVGLFKFFYVNSFLDEDLQDMYHASRINSFIGE